MPQRTGKVLPFTVNPGTQRHRLFLKFSMRAGAYDCDQLIPREQGVLHSSWSSGVRKKIDILLRGETQFGHVESEWGLITSNHISSCHPLKKWTTV